MDNFDISIRQLNHLTDETLPNSIKNCIEKWFQLTENDKKDVQLCKILVFALNLLRIPTQRIHKLVSEVFLRLMNSVELPVALVKVLGKYGKEYENCVDILFFIINWCSSILTKQKEIEESCVNSMIDFQIHYLLLLHQTPNYVYSCRLKFYYLLQKHSEYREIYVSKLTTNLPLMCLLVKHSTEEQRQLFFNMYTTQILNSKKDIDPIDLNYFTPLFSSITTIELDTILIPTLIRTMKRNSLQLLEPISHLLLHCNSDLTAYYLSLFLPLGKEFILSSETPDIRVILRYIHHLFQKSISSSYHKDIIDYVLSLLTPFPSHPDQRFLFLEFCYELIVLVPLSERDQYRDLITKKLFDYMKKETKESLIKKVHYIFGKWIQLTCPIAEEYIEFVSKPLKANGPQTLYPLISLSPLYELSTSLQMTFEEILKKGITSPATHLFLGWLTVPHLASTDLIWPIINDSNSFLYQDRLYQYNKTIEETREFEYIWMTICNIIGMIGKEFYKNMELNNCNEQPHPLFTVLAKFSLHHYPPIQKYARSSLTTLLETYPTPLIPSLLFPFILIISNNSSKTNYISDIEILRKTLYHLSFCSVSPSVIPYIAYIASVPDLDCGKKVITHLLHSIDAENKSTYLGDSLIILNKLLDGPYGLSSQHSMCRKISHRLLKAYGYFIHHSQYPQIWESISVLTNPDLLKQYDDEDAAIYFTQEGTLYEKLDSYTLLLQQVDSQEKPKVNSNTNNNMPMNEKAKMKQLDQEIKQQKLLEDKKKKEELEKAKMKQLDQEIKQQKLLEDKKKKEELEKAQKIENQTNKRNEMNAIIEPCLSGIIGFSKLMYSNPSEGIQFYLTIQDYLITWLKSPLTRSVALTCLQNILKALPSPLCHHSYDISIAFLQSIINPGLSENVPLFKDISILLSKGLESLLQTNQIAIEVISIFTIIFHNISIYNPPLPNSNSIINFYQYVIESGVNDNLYYQNLLPIRSSIILVLLHLFEIAPTVEPPISPLLLLFMSDNDIISSDVEALKYGCVSQHEHIRTLILQMIDSSTGPLPENILPYFFILTNDPKLENKTLANEIWTELACEFPILSYDLYLDYVDNSNPTIQLMVCFSISSVLLSHPELIDDQILHFQDLYEKSQTNDRLRTKSNVNARCGIMKIFEGFGNTKETALSDNQLKIIFTIIIINGFGDTDEKVRMTALNAGISIIRIYGSLFCESLVSIFEGSLDKIKDGSDEETKDHQKEGTVVLLGTITQYMQKDDPKIESIFQILLNALYTPSESVQLAVADCMTSIARTTYVTSHCDTIIADLLSTLFTSPDFSLRLGAANGIAGLLSGFGIPSLKKHDIMTKITEAFDGKSWEAKEGCLLLIECLSRMFKKKFDPYVIVILQDLLRGFSENVEAVRTAAKAASEVVMSNMSVYCIKQILPKVIELTGDSQWRTKVAAVQTLGTMANCSPQSLSSSLPQIVPKLVSCFGDSHPKVREAAKDALSGIGQVVSNPEISAISSILLEALCDPMGQTGKALETLTETSFIHKIDAASLSLIIPILQRGLGDRKTSVKQNACLIVGSICTLSDTQTVLPYIPLLREPLKHTLLDHDPLVRQETGHALGQLVKGVGETEFPDLIMWLNEQMCGEGDSAERSGSALGLAEVLAALGYDRLISLLFQIIESATHPKAHIREGVMWFISYLPTVISDKIPDTIEIIFPVIIQDLADETDTVSQVSLKAGKALISRFGLTHTKLLLAPILSNIVAENWRYRQSAVQLLGELLSKLCGNNSISLNGDEDDAEPVEYIVTANTGNDLKAQLGETRYNLVLSCLYLVRSDINTVVKQKSLQIWKSIVYNTPGTLKNILPTLLQLINDQFIKSGDLQLVAGKCLGDVVSKLGDSVIQTIVPLLERELTEFQDGKKRAGICMGLTEIIQSCPKRYLKEYLSNLIKPLEGALGDDDEEVRSGAAEAFSKLYSSVGPDCLKAILPHAIEEINSGTIELVRKGTNCLKGILLHQLNALENIVDTLLTKPLKIPNINALNDVVSSVGSVLHFQTSKIFTEFFTVLKGLPSDLNPVECSDPELASALEKCLLTVFINVKSGGIHVTIPEMMSFVTKDNWGWRVAALNISADYFGQTKVNFHPQIPTFIRGIIDSFMDPKEEVLRAAWNAIDCLVRAVTPLEMAASYVSSVRQAIILVSRKIRQKNLTSDSIIIPAFALSYDTSPFWNFLQHGLRSQSGDIRSESTCCLGEILQFSTKDHLSPSLSRLIMGILIRVSGDRFSFQLKCEILDTLCQLLVKGDETVFKAFIPQLHTTLIKALEDKHGSVRKHALSALSKLTPISTKNEILIKDLKAHLATAEDVSASESIYRGMRLTLLTSTTSLTPAVAEDLVSDILRHLNDVNESIRKLTAGILGIALKLCSEQVQITTFQALCTCNNNDNALVGRCAAIKSVAHHSEEATISNISTIVPFIKFCLQNENVVIRQFISEAIYCLVTSIKHQAKIDPSLIGYIWELLPNMEAELKTQKDNITMVNVLKTIKRLYRLAPKDDGIPYFKVIVPVLYDVAKSSSGAKIIAERTLCVVLQVKTPHADSLFNQCLELLPSAYTKPFTDYYKKVLTSIKFDYTIISEDEYKESDDEGTVAPIVF